MYSNYVFVRLVLDLNFFEWVLCERFFIRVSLILLFIYCRDSNGLNIVNYSGFFYNFESREDCLIELKRLCVGVMIFELVDFCKIYFDFEIEI